MSAIKTSRKKLSMMMMMMMLLCAVLSSQAQSLDDAVRFSKIEQGASARFKAMAGAQTALGGDLSSITGNPAGLGFYTASDASFSLGFQIDSNSTRYYEFNNEVGKNSFGLDQAGVLFHIPINKKNSYSEKPGWKNFNIGVSYTKTQNFTSIIDFDGESDISSFTDMIADESALVNTSYPNTDFNNIYDEWGYNSYLISNNGTFFYPTTSEVEKNYQTHLDKRSGKQYQNTISFGSNYGNKFYVGAALGIAGFHYQSDRNFTEQGYMKNMNEFNLIDPDSEFLDSGNQASEFLNQAYDLSYTANQFINGSGLNTTLGVIYLPNESWRIGLSASSPTWYKVRNDSKTYFDTWIVNATTDAELFHYQSPEKDGVTEQHNEYTLKTPYRINAGVVRTFNEGLISADAEFVDYSSIKISEDGFSDDVKAILRGAFNFRIGGEMIVDQQFLVRAGGSIQSSPYKSNDSSKFIGTLGLGYRFGIMYIDLAYLNQFHRQQHVPYLSSTNPTQAARSDNQRHTVLLNLGLKF